ERYLVAAQKIARLAVGDPALRPAVAIYKLPYLTLRQDERMSEDQPFGSRGGAAIRHYFPLDGEYEFKILLQRKEFNTGAEIRGLDIKNDIDLRVDGVRVKLFTLDIRKYGQQNISEDFGDKDLVVRMPMKAGSRMVTVSFNAATWYPEGIVPSTLPAGSNAYAYGRKSDDSYSRIDAGVDELDITGPFQGSVADEVASRRKIFLCHPVDAKDGDLC